MAPIFMMHDIVEANGKTIKETNLALQHKIPVGTLVEVDWQQWHGDGACWSMKARLWVVEHTRDCDGTPLYSIGRRRTLYTQYDQFRGFAEDSLIPVEITPAIADGYDMPDWWQEDE